MPESTTLPDANLRTLLVSIDVHSGQSGFWGLQISVGVGPRPHTIIRDENFFRRSTGDRRHPSLRSAPFFPDRYGRPHESRFSLPGRNFNRWTHRGGGVGDIWRDHARDCRAAKTELTPRSDAFQPSSARSDGCPSWRFSGISTPKKTAAAVDGRRRALLLASASTQTVVILASRYAVSDVRRAFLGAPPSDHRTSSAVPESAGDESSTSCPP